MIPPGTPVRCVAGGGLPLYGRLKRAPKGAVSALVYVRLTADHRRGRKGQCVYALARTVAPYRRGRHASGVRTWGPAWLRRLKADGKERVKL